MKIGQLCIFRLSSPAEHPYGAAVYGSRYQGQRGPTPSRAWQSWRTWSTRGALTPTGRPHASKSKRRSRTPRRAPAARDVRDLRLGRGLPRPAVAGDRCRVHRAYPDRFARPVRVHDPVPADVHADVVHRAVVEDEVAGAEHGAGHRLHGLALLGRVVRQAYARLGPRRHGQTGTVVVVRSVGPPHVGLADLAAGVPHGDTGRTAGIAERAGHRAQLTDTTAGAICREPQLVEPLDLGIDDLFLGCQVGLLCGELGDQVVERLLLGVVFRLQIRDVTDLLGLAPRDHVQQRELIGQRCR